MKEVIVHIPQWVLIVIFILYLINVVFTYLGNKAKLELDQLRKNNARIAKDLKERIETMKKENHDREKKKEAEKAIDKGTKG